MPDGSGWAVIPSLPKHICDVPGFETREDDRWRAEWFKWRDKLLIHRELVHQAAEGDDGFLENEKLLCADDPKYWAAVWGWVYEPRARLAQGKHLPYTPFAFQCHVLDFFRAMADDPEQWDAYLSKSRGIGLSWTIVAFAVWGWNFHEVTTLLLSRTMSEVDRPNNINTLFGKSLYLIKQTPELMLPYGFDRDKHRTQLNIYNPETDAQIFGDSTTADSGRGDRASIAFPDEAAFVQNLRDMLTTLDGTTDHTCCVSTESLGKGTTWWNIWNNAKREQPEHVWTLDFWVNPYQDEEWREREYKRRLAKQDEAGYWTEVMRNPWRGRSSIIYPDAANIVFNGPPYDPSLPVIIGIDPGVVDDTAIIFGQPLSGDHKSGTVNWLDSYERSGMPAEYYAHLLTGIEPEEGDVCFGLDFDHRALHDLMPWTRNFPWGSRVKVVMDPAGKQRDSGKPNRNSFQLRLYEESKKLFARERERNGLPHGGTNIYPLCEKLVALNAHQARHNAARDLLTRSTFLDSYGARRLVNALTAYRLGELTPKATREPVPIHDDDNSHLATAFEFVAVYRSSSYLSFDPKRRAETAADWQMPAFEGSFA
jgi:hypothetical protein